MAAISHATTLLATATFLAAMLAVHVVEEAFGPYRFERDYMMTPEPLEWARSLIRIGVIGIIFAFGYYLALLSNRRMFRACGSAVLLASLFLALANWAVLRITPVFDWVLILSETLGSTVLELPLIVAGLLVVSLLLNTLGLVVLRPLIRGVRTLDE